MERREHCNTHGNSPCGCEHILKLSVVTAPLGLWHGIIFLLILTPSMDHALSKEAHETQAHSFRPPPWCFCGCLHVISTTAGPGTTMEHPKNPLFVDLQHQQSLGPNVWKGCLIYAWLAFLKGLQGLSSSFASSKEFRYSVFFWEDSQPSTLSN